MSKWGVFFDLSNDIYRFEILSSRSFIWEPFKKPQKTKRPKKLKKIHQTIDGSLSKIDQIELFGVHAQVSFSKGMIFLQDIYVFSKAHDFLLKSDTSQ